MVPDVLLVDYQLGEGMDGLATIAKLREVYGRIPVRLVTANRTREVEEAARRADVGVLYKPIAPRDLERFVSDPD